MRLQLMKTCLLLIAAALTGVAVGQEKDKYPVPAEAKRKPGVPQGRVDGPFRWKQSKIFPGTTREYWLYIPAQYDESKPACLLVVQDGLGRAKNWRLPTIMDNLIHEGAMPVTIGLFVTPGVVPATGESGQARYNRSFEYDSLGDRYARFLSEELIPEAGKRVAISDDPNDRALAGASSGGICAFNAAWERPDQFRRVISTIGTFVGLRGGDAFPILVRKCEPKPLRIFLQDGRNDLNIYGGDWWMANQSMLSALRFSGYDVRHIWGEGGHNGRHSAAIMPEALRWLWRDYPEPISAGAAEPAKRRTDILIPGEGWRLISDGHRFTEGPAVNSKGELFFTDVPAKKIHRVGLNGDVTVFCENSGGANGLMFGSDGKLYACISADEQIARFNEDGQREVLIREAPCNDLVLLGEFGFYTDPKNKKVWRFTIDGERTVVDEGIEFANGVICSPDHEFLTVADTRGRFTYHYKIQPDGTLAHKQRLGWLHLGDADKDSGADGLTCDTKGRIYVTTRLGVQVMDQLGRVHLILSKPGSGWLSNAVLGGKDGDTLYVTCGDAVYARRLNAQGVRLSKGPIPQPKPGL